MCLKNKNQIRKSKLKNQYRKSKLRHNIGRFFNFFSQSGSYRSSHGRCSVKKGVPRNFAKFIWKHLCQSLFLNKVADIWPATLFKKRLWHRCFHVNFAKFLRSPFFKKHLRWLLLFIVPAKILKNQVRVILDSSQTICQINQEIQKA